MDPGHYTTVLVAVMNNCRDLTIAREQHWYRIPVKSAPARGVNAPVIAFYQTAAFPAEKWSIRYYAHVSSWETVPRIVLLPEEPAHPRAHDPYYKAVLEDLQCLPRAITSHKYHRLTFAITHWEKLLSAHDLTELLHGSIWEERLWAALRRLGKMAEEDEIDEW